ncbi:MAG: diguanylate cyclase [Clostridia bacterium]|nr:diguanylate cyclase [Clostridia bacterium]
MKDNKSKKRFSVKRKMYIFVVFTILASALGTAAIAFITGANQIDNYYKQAAKDNARNYASLVSKDADYLQVLRKEVESEEYQAIRDAAEEADDEEPVIEYLKEKGLWEKYCEIRESLAEYISNIEDIEYLYLTAHGDRNADHDMYLIDGDLEVGVYETGYYEEREAELLGKDLEFAGEPTISHGDWGWLCSAFMPVYASDGTCVCVTGCDFKMDEVMAERQELLMYLVIGSLIFTVAVLAGAVFFINKIVVKPLDSMTREMKRYKPSERVTYEEAGVMDLGIKSRDEIGEIYEGIRTMQMDIVDYINDMSVLEEDKIKAENDVRDKEKRIGELSVETYKDALTGTGNKAAYIKRAQELNEMIKAGGAEFALVMVDMNDLKGVNDNYGHKAGDLYIQGCCRQICDVFGDSSVYRIGGDEFVVVLTDNAYKNRKELFDKLHSDFEKSYCQTGVEEWKRYSAALGMAEYASDDSSVELVFKSADKAMYEDKARFKSEHGTAR